MILTVRVGRGGVLRNTVMLGMYRASVHPDSADGGLRRSPTVASYIFSSTRPNRSIKKKKKTHLIAAPLQWRRSPPRLPLHRAFAPTAGIISSALEHGSPSSSLSTAPPAPRGLLQRADPPQPSSRDLPRPSPLKQRAPRHRRALHCELHAPTNLHSQATRICCAKSTCCKRMFQLFYMFQMYVASVSYGCCKSRSGCYINCKCFQRHVASVCSKCFICFRRMLQSFFYLDVV
jgi:hypothetical protein